MPVAGLPKVLENTLTSILDTYDIRTWSIFAEENGEISLRIKFNMADLQSNDMGAHSTCMTSTTYKKKSVKQVARDKNRALKRRRVNNSNLDSSIETDRAEINEQDISKPCINCSPSIIHEECITVDNDPPHVLDIPNADDLTQPKSCAFENTEKTTDDLTPSEFCASQGIDETEIANDVTCNDCNSCTPETPDQDLRENTPLSVSVEDQQFLSVLRAAFRESAEEAFEKFELQNYT